MTEQEPLAFIHRTEAIDSGLTEEDRRLISARIEDHRLNPLSAVFLETMKK